MKRERYSDFAIRATTIDGQTTGTAWLGNTRLATIKFDTPDTCTAFLEVIHALARHRTTTSGPATTPAQCTVHTAANGFNPSKHYCQPEYSAATDATRPVQPRKPVQRPDIARKPHTPTGDPQ